MATTEYQEFRALLDQGKLRQAIQLAETQSMAGPRQSEFWLTQLAVALTRAKKFPEAVRAATQALDASPRAPWALLARANARKRMRDFESALADFQEALATNEERLMDRARNGCLDCLAGMKNWERMLELAEQWMPGPAGYKWRAKAYTNLGRFDQAMEQCKMWLRQSPDNPGALWELTELEIRREGIDSVINRVRRIARIPSRPVIYREIYASLLRRAGREEEAVEEYQKLLTFGDHAKAMRQQAFIKAKNGQELEAIPIMEELLRLDPADQYVHSSYGAACKRVNQAKRACEFYHELLGQYPEQKHLYGKIKRLENRKGGK